MKVNINSIECLFEERAGHEYKCSGESNWNEG